ncbi:nucleoside kinase [Sodaliphilus sp.]|uniref:nucleoside kinase n=1 Tax=Sodaliphilus sp. TaxID=2815818 RepID=UPI00388DE629
MNNSIKIFCKNTQEYVAVNGGDSLLDVLGVLELDMQPLCALVNNKVVDLSFNIYSPKQVEFLDYSHPAGARCYVHSLCMVLYKAITDLYPGKRLRIEHSLKGGYYCRIKHEHATLDASMVAALKAHMQEIIAQDLPLVRHEEPTQDVARLFEEQGLNDKVRVLSTCKDFYYTYYTLDNLADAFYGPLVPRTGMLTSFDLLPYESGMILLAPDKDMQPAVAEKQPKMFKAFTDYVAFNDIIGLGDVGILNKAIREKKAPMLINVAEALHNKMFAAIAHEIAKRYQAGGARVVLIAGPSSSGKTTSSKRLAIQLVTNYIMPKVIELDNYFVNRDKTPRDESGDYDYESLYALDLELFNSDLTRLLAGEEVAMPTYNFTTGSREYRGNTLKLEKNNILLIEGIHGLNPELTKQIPEEQKFRLYVSALTTLSIDDHNWIPTSDNRLLRRIVRDNKYRGSNAQSTIARWASVRRGEDKWIYPFQENADATFNSSLIFELAVMKMHAEPVLRQVPVNSPEYAEAHRLLKFLNYFEPLDEKDIPSTSLLREFLGGSSFTY